MLRGMSIIDIYGNAAKVCEHTAKPLLGLQSSHSEATAMEDDHAREPIGYRHVLWPVHPGGRGSSIAHGDLDVVLRVRQIGRIWFGLRCTELLNDLPELGDVGLHVPTGEHWVA